MAVTFSNLINIFATPTEVFLNLKEQPRWFVAFVFISAVSIGVARFLAPASEQIVINMFSEKIDEIQIQRSLATAKRLQYIAYAFTPVVLLLRWIIVASILYYLCLLLGVADPPRFRTVFAVVVYSEMILLLMAITNTLLLYARGIDSMRHLIDLQAIAGLDILLKDKSASIPLFVLLNSFNFFSVWYIVTLTLGISVVTSFSKLKSAILVSGVWLLGVGYQVALAAISINSPLRLGR